MSRKNIRLPRPKPKAKISPPTLPQHQHSAPFSLLMTLGKDDYPAICDQVAETLRAGQADQAAAKLLEMALDESYYDYDEDYEGGTAGDPRTWTRLHALRVLMRMGVAARIGIAPLLPLLDDEDDFLREEMPFYYAAMGRPAIEPLANVLHDRDAETFQRVGAGESLAEMGEMHPDLCAEVIPLLEQALLTEQEDDTLAGYLVLNLLDLFAVRSLPIIEKAFEEGRVDETIVELADVQEHFDLPVTASRRQWNYDLDEDEEIEEIEEIEAEMGFVEEEEIRVPYVAEIKVGRNDPVPAAAVKNIKNAAARDL